jgi:hypothetical protein
MADTPPPPLAAASGGLAATHPTALTQTIPPTTGTACIQRHEHKHKKKVFAQTGVRTLEDCSMSTFAAEIALKLTP